MVPPSSTTTASVTGSPRPGIKSPASNRSIRRNPSSSQRPACANHANARSAGRGPPSARWPGAGSACAPSWAGSEPARVTLLEADDHRVGSDELFDVAVPEADVGQPRAALGAGVVEAVPGHQEHGDAHEQAERVGSAVVVDEALVDDQRSAV